MNSSKEHIILVASRLFLQKNFKEVTMKDIVEKTGMSKGAFYHYFKSKAQLFLEVLEYFLNSMSRNYENYSKESLYQFYNDYINETISLSKKYLENFKNEQSEGSIAIDYFSLLVDAMKLFPEFREKMINGYNEEISHWTKAIKQARSKGEIRSTMTDKEIGEVFMYLSDGVGMHMILRGADIENMVKPFKNLWDKFYKQIKV